MIVFDSRTSSSKSSLTINEEDELNFSIANEVNELSLKIATKLLIFDSVLLLL